MAYCVSLAEHGSLSAGRHWRFSREYAGISRRNAMYTIGYSSVVSPFPTVMPKIVLLNFFNRDLTLGYSSASDVYTLPKGILVTSSFHSFSFSVVF